MVRAHLLTSLVVYLLGAAHAFAADGTAPPLDDLLAGEFALQEGRPEEAARHYAEAALASRDPRLAERAAKLGLLAKQPDAARRVYDHWRELEPGTASLAQFELALGLQYADAELAQAAAAKLLERPGGWRPVLAAVMAEPEGLVARGLIATLADQKAVQSELDALLAVGGAADRLQLEGLIERIGEMAVERFPERARAWLWRAEAARKRGHESLALASVQHALGLPDLSQDLRMAAAAMLAMLDQPKAGADALAGGEQTEAVWAARAAYLARSEDAEAIAAFVQELTSEQTGKLSDERRYVLGQLAELTEDLEAARKWYETITEPERLPAATLRLAVLTDKAGDLTRARSMLQALQESDLDDGKALIDAFLLEAELLAARGDLDAAIEVYDRGLHRFEEDSGLLYARALMHERRDAIDLAEKDLRRMLELDPDNADVLNALGYTLADRTDRYEEAHGYIERALAKQPDNPAVIDSMGWVLFRLGEAEKALPYLKRAFELQRDAEVAAHLGEVLWTLGQQDEARSIWRLGREIDADNRALKAVLERLAPEL